MEKVSLQSRYRLSASQAGALIGNVLNHYDSSLFGWISPFLAPILFPGKGGMEALLLTFALIPLRYLTKPLGAFFWGWVGDRWGRKPALIASLIGMALSTSAMGCLPLTGSTWIMLTFARLFQGFFAAGEEKGAALYLLEHTALEKRSWMSALYDASGILGIFLASLLASQFGESHWRLLFWIGAATGLFGLFLRHHAEESPEFKPALFSWKMLWDHKQLIFRISIVSGFSYANYFLVTVFLNGFLPKITSLSKADVLLFNTHLLWIDFFLLLGFGTLCRWISKEKLMATAAFLTAIFAIPLFASLDNASWGHAAAIRLLFVTFGVALAAPYHAWKLQLLPTHHRFLIGSLASTLGSKFFGAPMPAIATFLAVHTGLTWTAALPLVVLAAAAAGVLLLKPLEKKVVFEKKDSRIILAVLRFSHDLPLDQKVLDATVAELKNTSYQRTVSLKEAPAKTDCVTAIHYLVQKAFQINLPRAWVGDMPHLLSRSHWNLHIIEASELKTGDLLFLKQQQQPKLISHVAIALCSDQLFHCTSLLGPVVQSVAQVFEQYEQQLKEDLTIYIDSRNTSLREQHGGMYIKD